MNNFDLRKYLAEGKLLKEDEKPTHRILCDVYYVNRYPHQDFFEEAVPEYEIYDVSDMLGEDDENYLYIDSGTEGTFDGEMFETEDGSNTRVESKYVEEIDLAEGKQVRVRYKGDNYDTSYDLENIKNTDILKIGGHLANHLGFPLRNVKISDDIIILGRNRYQVVPKPNNDFDIINIKTKEIIDLAEGKLNEAQNYDIEAVKKVIKEELYQAVLHNDDVIYDNLYNIDHEHLISQMLSAVESNPKITLRDYLQGFDYGDED